MAALGQLGPAAATPEVVAVLVAHIRDRLAAKAFQQLAAAMPEEVAAALVPPYQGTLAWMEKPDVAVEMMKAGLRVFKKRGLAGWEVRHISELGA